MTDGLYLQIEVLLVPIVSLFVLWRAKSKLVKFKAFCTTVLGGFVYVLWYVPSLATGLPMSQLALAFRVFLATGIENTSSAFLWAVLFPVDLVIGATGTQIRTILWLKKILTASFWIVTGWIVWEGFSVAAAASLYALLIPLSTTILTRWREITEHVPRF